MSHSSDQRSSDIFQLLRKPRQVMIDYVENDSEWSGSPISQFANEHFLALGEGGEALAEHLRQAINILQNYELVALEHLEAIALLFATDQPPVNSMGVLARTVVELCARACWLADPETNMQSRVARGFAEKIASIDAGIRINPSRDYTNIPTESTKQTELDVLKKTLNEYGICEVKRPTATNLVGHYLQGGDPEVPRLYPTLSAIPHGALWAITSFSNTEKTGGEESENRISAVDRVRLEGPVNICVLAFCQSMELVSTLLAWPIDPINEIRAEADRVFGID